MSLNEYFLRLLHSRTKALCESGYIQRIANDKWTKKMKAEENSHEQRQLSLLTVC